MATVRRNLNELSPEALRAELAPLKLPDYRVRQLEKWLARGVSFDEMTDLPAELRRTLSETYGDGVLRTVGKLVSAVDGTVKYLFDLGDGNLIESVLMKYKYGYSACVSTQAGCKMGCTFCASAKAGFGRDLTAGEIAGQIKAMERDAGVKVGHVVMMGVGEPLDNFDNVLAFMHIAHDPEGLNISYRKMSLSTCGLIPGIKRLMEEDLPITLSVSLHSPFQEERARMMPVANKYSLDKLLEICKIYSSGTGRRVTYEYAMISGVNDTDAHADELIRLLGGTLCHINLIPVNTVKGTGYARAQRERIDSFRARLERGGLAATVRRAMGRDIEAACGQLRRQALEESQDEVRRENR
ncbi:MAG: 23S rRNA (adenine(2503)-C(2))-methyltransferase RlmN [Clostridia bacterium]|nr:23S rRNA (adenine(2503)-C(2))-methyltransferase RlmN [Clostridia bacterium]